MSEQEKDPTAQPVEPAGVSRRKFVTTVAATGAGLTIVPRHVLGRGFQAPSDTVNIATVGIGGMGGSNTRSLMSQNIVAVCDVDWGYAEKRFDAYKMELSRLQGGTAQNQAQSNRPRPILSKAQMDADAKRPMQDSNANLKRFVEQQLPKIQRYTDYRQMLDKQKDIDGIVVATPGSHARGDCVGGDGCWQTRVRPEAALLVGAGSAAPGGEGKDRRRS